MVAAINATMTRYQIDQAPRRVRYFIAQSFFETQSFTLWSENLTYTTPERLCEVWPSRFSMTHADGNKAYAPDYVKNPQKLASLVYASRVGNGNDESGDGWTFRGRGAFHLTFRGNYASYSRDEYGDDRIITSPDLVSRPLDAFASAGWFWHANALSPLADSDSFSTLTKCINGSDATVSQRLDVLNRVNAILQW
jgi:putative chitinase